MSMIKWIAVGTKSLVTVGSRTLARPASPLLYQIFVRSVEWQPTLFNCPTRPMRLTVQDLLDNLAAVADFLNLDKR